ncbi:MAG: hypothetical protein BWZ06_01777 [Bacteroidetes bacterium ADurb.BinA261]|nr:MAG: hypothetical protein BWZ06_01777 [Bacteroidetes bacterium ADurb.BinA261]
MSTQVAIGRNAQFHATGIEQCVESAMHNALRADVHPAASSHLTIICHTHLSGYFPIVLIVELSDHHRVGDNYTWRVGFRFEQTERMSAFDDECLVLRQFFEISFDEAVLHPVLTNLTGFAVGNQLVGIKRNIEAEVIVDHHLKSFSFDAFPLVFVDGFGFQIAFGTIAIPIDAATCF